MSAIFELNAVYKYPNGDVSKTPLLKNITAQVSSGSMIAVIGPSGSGKSTLLRLFNRTTDPEKGVIKYLGENIKHFDPVILRRQVGLVQQTPVMLPGTVLDNICFGPRQAKKTLSLKEAEQLMDLAGLEHKLLHQNAANLSGGQKQRVALLRTLANKPKVLLLDEVTSALDAVTAEQIEQLIIALNHRHRLTVLWVTHNLTQAEKIGSTIWFVKNGGLAEVNDTGALFAERTDAPPT